MAGQSGSHRSSFQRQLFNFSQAAVLNLPRNFPAARHLPVQTHKFLIAAERIQARRASEWILPAARFTRLRVELVFSIVLKKLTG